MLALARQHGRPLHTLIAQSDKNDPFLADQPWRLRQAEWFAEVWARVGAQPGFHLRRFHYRVMSQDPPIMMPDGSRYINEPGCIETLMRSGRDARHLGLINSADLIDQKNPDPVINLRGAVAAVLQFRGGLETEEPELHIPRLALNEPRVAQPYHVEIWCEKSTMNDILLPLGERFGINIQIATGEQSEIRCDQLVRRAQESGKPVRILYVSDFDPHGHTSMPIAVARKVEFILAREDLDGLDVRCATLC